MLSKLKYVGVPTEDLLMVYSLHIHSVTEYCSTAFHSSLSQKLSNKLEAIQKTCLRVILAEMYIDYISALEMCAIQSLFDRRKKQKPFLCHKMYIVQIQYVNVPLEPIPRYTHSQT